MKLLWKFYGFSAKYFWEITILVLAQLRISVTDINNVQ